MDLLNNGYYNSQAVQVLNAVEYDEFDNPIGLYESPSDPSSCNFTVSDNSRCKFVDSNCFQQQVSTCYMTVTGLLATDTVTVFGSSAVPTLSAGRMDFVVGSKYYGISIFRSGILWAYYPLCESIINPSGHIYRDVSGNGNHATLINGSVGNKSRQNEFHYLQKGFMNSGVLCNITNIQTAYNSGLISNISYSGTWQFDSNGNLEILSGGALYLYIQLNYSIYQKFTNVPKDIGYVGKLGYEGSLTQYLRWIGPQGSSPSYSRNFGYWYLYNGDADNRYAGNISIPFPAAGSKVTSIYLEQVSNLPKHLTNNTDYLGNTLTNPQDGKSFLPSGCYLQQYSTNTNLKTADSTVGLWYGPEGDPYKVSYNTLCLQDPWNEQVFIGNKTKDYKLGPISTHYNNLTSVQKLTERIVRNVVDDPLIEDPAFSHDVKVTASDLIYSLYNQAGYTMNGIIDWGDGTTQSVNTTSTQAIAKTYEIAGTYTVKFTGTMEYLNCFYAGTTVNPFKVTKINNWGACGFKYLRLTWAKITSIPNGPITGLNQTSCILLNTFQQCSYLTGNIPSDLLLYAKACTSVSNLLSGCIAITGQIPENLFRYCPNLTTVASAFSGCTGLTGQIPEELLKYNPLITNAAALFYGCGGLTGSIPEDLFRYNPLITTFASGDNGVFYGCSKLTGSIPANLFKYNTVATVFDHAFCNCTGLTGSIPETLFQYNTEMQIASGIFLNCSGLTGSIPENLFLHNTKITRLGYGDRGCFAGCTGLTGSIPETLFSTLTVCTQFTCVFYRCSGLTSIPQYLFRYNTAAIDLFSVFEGCTGITSIPTGLFDYNTNVTIFTGTFRNTRITTIPSNLFVNNTKVASFRHTFSANPSLAAIPSNIFDSNSLVTTFANVFSDCAGITSIPTYLFKFNMLVTDMSSVFMNTRITAIPVDIFRYNTLVTTFGECFSNIGLTTPITLPVGLFSYNTEVTNFGRTFQNTAITGITSTLFQNNPKVTTFAFAFYASIRSSFTIPTDLFRYNPLVTDFLYCFAGCLDITLDEFMFSYNTEVQNFTSVFNGCRLYNLTSNIFKNNTKVTNFTAAFANSPITTIPADIFRYNVNVTNFQQIFSGCSQLLALPEDLFYYNDKVTTFAYAFYQTRNFVLPTRLFNTANLSKVTTWQNFLNVTSTTYSPTGTIQKIWDVSEGGDVTYTVQPTKTDAFNNCTALSNYAEIPVAWT